MTTPKSNTQSDETSAANPPKEGTADWLKSRGWKDWFWVKRTQTQYWVHQDHNALASTAEAIRIEKQREKEQQQ